MDTAGPNVYGPDESFPFVATVFLDQNSLNQRNFVSGETIFNEVAPRGQFPPIQVQAIDDSWSWEPSGETPRDAQRRQQHRRDCSTIRLQQRHLRRQQRRQECSNIRLQQRHLRRQQRRQDCRNIRLQQRHLWRQQRRQDCSNIRLQQRRSDCSNVT